MGLASLFNHRAKVLRDNPSFVFVMNCDICSDFPFYDMLKFQEKTCGLLTVMTTHDNDDDNHQGLGCFDMDNDTKELLHYNSNFEGG